MMASMMQRNDKSAKGSINKLYAEEVEGIVQIVE